MLQKNKQKGHKKGAVIDASRDAETYPRASSLAQSAIHLIVPYDFPHIKTASHDLCNAVLNAL